MITTGDVARRERILTPSIPLIPPPTRAIFRNARGDDDLLLHWSIHIYFYQYNQQFGNVVELARSADPMTLRVPYLKIASGTLYKKHKHFCVNLCLALCGSREFLRTSKVTAL